MDTGLQHLEDASFCYLTTTGRVSGRPHTIEIWFALSGHTIYMLSGGMDRSDWVKNALKSPGVTVRIRHATFSGNARLVTGPEEDALARHLVGTKYDRPEGDRWQRTSLPLAVDLQADSIRTEGKQG